MHACRSFGHRPRYSAALVGALLAGGCHSDALAPPVGGVDQSVAVLDSADSADLAVADLEELVDLIELRDLAPYGPCGNTAGLQARAAWPMRGGCPTHDGRSAKIGPAKPKLHWTLSFPNQYYEVRAGAAIGADGTVYFGALDANLYALDGANGNQKWVFRAGDAFAGTPAIGADGTVYATSLDSSVYALDGATGRVRWSFAAAGSIVGSPALGADGTLYFGAVDHTVYAIGP